MTSLPEIFRIIISFLEKEGYNYLVIGGVASAVLGYPRMTQDVDICIHIKKKDVLQFLDKLEKRVVSCTSMRIIVPLGT